MKKTSVIFPSYVWGGHEIQALHILEQLVDHTDITVFLNDSSFKSKFDGMRLNVVVSEGEFLIKGNVLKQFIWGFIRRTRIANIQKDFDTVLVVAGTLEAGVLVGVANLVSKNKSIIYLPFFYFRTGILGFGYNLLLSLFFKLYHRAIAINHFHARVFRTLAPHLKVDIVRNSIGKRHFRAKNTSKVSRLVFIGRLSPQKGLLQLLSWLNCKDNPIQEILVIGDGPLKAQLELLISSLTFINVKLVGWLSAEQQDLELSKCDILVMNSVFEGEPTVIRESLARGMRVISRDIFGVNGVVDLKSRFSSKAELIDLLKKVANSEEYVAPNSRETRIEALRSVQLNRLFM